MKSLMNFLESQKFLVKGHTKKQLKTPVSLEEIYDYIDDLFSGMFKNFNYKHINTIDNPNIYFKQVSIDVCYSLHINVQDIENNEYIKNIKNVIIEKSDYDDLIKIKYNYEQNKTIVMYVITAVGVKRQKYILYNK